MGRLGLLMSGVALAAMAFASPCTAAHHNVRAELAQKKAEAVQLAQKSKQIQTQVDTLKTRLVDTTKVLRDTEDKISDTNGRLQDLEAEKSQRLKSFYADQQALGGLVTAAQKYNRTSTPDMLVQSTPLDAARASLVMKSMIPALQDRSEKLKAEVDEMERIEARISDELTEQSKQHDKLTRQQAQLDKLLKERKDVYQKTEDSRKAQEAEVEKLAAEARNLEDLVDRIKPKTKSRSAYRLPSNLPLPVSGTVRTGFGERDDYGSTSQGVTFETPSGATVVTPLAGKVRFAGKFQKYKQILIVEHAGGYYSLIAGLGRIDTVVGASLAAGEPVGAAENSASARVYYELRQDGEPVNPRKLVLAQKKQEKS